jgi:hypothetical protein
LAIFTLGTLAICIIEAIKRTKTIVAEIFDLLIEIFNFFPFPL